MNQHAELFAIKLMIKSLKYSDTYKQSILSLIDDMIKQEDSRCSDEYKAKLESINQLIDENI